MVRNALGSLALLLLAACEPPAGPAVDYRPGEAGTVDHALCLLGFSAVPVRAVAPGHHLVEATIDGETGFFVLDTGANVTAITRSQAEGFGLSPGEGGGPGLRGVVRQGAGGRADRVAIDSFGIGPITVRQSRIVIADMDQLLASLSRVSGVEVVGILGQDVLNEHRAIIDVRRPMLYLMDEDQDPAPVPAEQCGPAAGDGADAADAADAG